MNKKINEMNEEKAMILKTAQKTAITPLISTLPTPHSVGINYSYPSNKKRVKPVSMKQLYEEMNILLR